MGYFDTIESEVDDYPKVLELVDSPFMEIERTLEGQRVEDGVIYLGARTGPCISVDNILHELAHFIEIDEARMHLGGWGFKYGQTITIPGHGTWEEFHKDQHINREIRTWAIQWHLQRFIGKPVSARELGKPGKYLPALWNALPHNMITEVYFKTGIEYHTSKRCLDDVLTELRRRQRVLETKAAS